jgi:hypothetical protein
MQSDSAKKTTFEEVVGGTVMARHVARINPHLLPRVGKRKGEKIQISTFLAFIEGRLVLRPTLLLHFVSLGVDGVEHSFRYFRLPPFRYHQREIFVKLLVVLRQLQQGRDQTM